eukprot:6766213-Prymnesium_polylepis.1
MLSAHRTGRGIVGYFETAEEAEALRATLVRLDGESQARWAGFAQDLQLEAEPCHFYKAAEGADRQAATPGQA